MVNYEILQGNFEDMFDIDKTTGNIHVKPNQLTQLNIPNHIVLTVRAYDLGIPQMSSLVKVFIYVLVNINRLIKFKSLNLISFFFHKT